MMINNNKAAVGDSIIGFAVLLVIILVSAVIGLILWEFNEGMQSSGLITDDAKAASSYATTQYTPLINYAFLFGFLSFVIYTIVTSVLISKIHPIFWVVGVVMSLAGVIVFTILKYIYEDLRSVAILGPFIQAIPGAHMIMTNIELIGVVWIFIQFTLMYKFREA